MRLEGSNRLGVGPPPLKACRTPIQMADREVFEKCAQCGANSFDQGLTCQKCHTRTHYLRAHGWYKPKSSANWYCAMCVLVNEWADPGKTAAMDTALEWLCSSDCREHARAHRLRVANQPRPIAASSSSSSTAPPAPAGDGPQSQRDWSIAEGLKNNSAPRSPRSRSSWLLPARTWRTCRCSSCAP